MSRREHHFDATVAAVETPAGTRALRELTKSMLRLPWAASLFGLRQAARWVDPDDGLSAAKTEMDEVSYTMERRLDNAFGEVHRAGRHVQEGMVDAVFALFGGSWAISDRALGRAWRAIDRS